MLPPASRRDLCARCSCWVGDRCLCSWYQALSDANVPWKCYGMEICSALLFTDTRKLADVENMGFFEDFLKDAKAGSVDGCEGGAG